MGGWLAVGISRASPVGDGAQAALPGWSLRADEVDGFNQGAGGARADLFEQRWANQVELGSPGGR